MVEIITLGAFDVRISGISQLQKYRRSYKNLELFKYLVANREKRLTPERIAESIWGESDYVDYKNALRTQIFRLRQIFFRENEERKRKRPEALFRIEFSGGCYVFGVGAECSLDSLHFEEMVRKADLLRKDDPDGAVAVYIHAIQLYQGEYMEDTPDCEWIFPIRNRYRRLYVQSLLRLFGLLREQGRYQDIVNLFEQSVSHEPFEESVHVCFLEALMELKEYHVALSHYRYITEKMRREFSAKPSPALTGIFSKITAGEQNFHRVGFSELRRSFVRPEESDGALFCGLEYFRILYSMEERKSLRKKSNAFLGLITILGSGKGLTAEKLSSACADLNRILKASLRHEDAFTQWSRYQMVVLLANADKEGAMQVSERIQREFASARGNEMLWIDTSFQPVASSFTPIFE